MKKLILIITSCFMLTLTVFANENYISENNYNYSVQEIVDEINEKYDIGLSLIETPQSKVKIKTLTREEFKSHLEEKAIEIVKHRTEQRKLFEERTGRLSVIIDSNDNQESDSVVFESENEYVETEFIK